MPRLDTTYDLRPADVIRFMTITTSSAAWTVLPTLRQAIGVMLRNPSTNTINIAISHTSTPAAGLNCSAGGLTGGIVSHWNDLQIFLRRVVALGNHSGGGTASLQCQRESNRWTSPVSPVV